MKAVIALSCLLSISMAAVLSDLPNDWLSYKAKYDKSYDGQVDVLRRKIYEENMNKIKQHNRKYEAGHVTYFLGETLFTDMLEIEVSEKWKGVIIGGSLESGMSTPYESSNLTLPSSVDWRQKGAVTPIKNQGSCGSCWAFSAVAAIEGQNAISSGSLISLSEEQLIECDKSDRGCECGCTSTAISYVQNAGGIDSDAAYPYTSKSGRYGSCKFNSSAVAAKVTGWRQIKQNDESALQEAVANVGPISIIINTPEQFNNYKGGVLCGFGCDPSRQAMDHAVAIVGYGEDASGGDYWLIKNSWSTKWGEDGYARICRNKDNEICVATYAILPTV